MVNHALEKGKSTSDKFEDYTLDEDGLLRFLGRMYMPMGGEIRRTVMDESHWVPYSAHPGVRKCMKP